MDFARVLEPALTTVALDAELLGATAFELLMRAHGRWARAAADRAPRRARRPRLDRAAAVSDSARAVFQAHAEGYDAERRRLLPCFDAFYTAAIDALGLCERPLRRVLDLGAGTGMLAGAVAREHPAAELTLLDGAAAMLEQARARIGDSARYVVADLADPLPAGPWDAIVSALAIHHLDDPAKRDLFARVRAALAAGRGLRQRRAGRRRDAVARRRLRRAPRARRARPGRRRRGVGRGRGSA